jgi:TonB family protein
VAPSPPPRPERGGLTLGGPSAGATLPPPTAPGSGKRPAGRSIRDQLAGIGAGLGDDDTPGRETIRLDSQEPRYLDTLARIKRRIELVWGYPEEAMLAGIGGEVLLMFTMRKTGTLTGVRLLQGSGYPSLDQEALRAIKAAAPFDPFPPQTVEDPVNILASFHYNSPYRFRRN